MEYIYFTVTLERQTFKHLLLPITWKMPSWIAYRALIDKIRGHKPPGGWKGKMDQVVAALFPPKTYAFVPKALVTYASKQKYLLKITGEWGILLRLINTNYDVKPDEMDKVASLVCARPPDKYGVPLHMVAASSKEWCEGMPSFSSREFDIFGSAEEKTPEKEEDDYEILYEVLKLATKDHQKVAKGLFLKYGLAANLILNSFPTHEAFLKWEAESEEGDTTSGLKGIKARSKTKTKTKTKRPTSEVYALQMIWDRWQALTNVEKHLMDLQTHLAMDDEDETLYALRNVLEINPALSEPILRLVRMDPFSLHDMLPRSFPLAKCLAIAKRVGMDPWHPYHVIRLISEAIAEEEADGHSFASYDEATMFHGDVKQRCHKMAVEILSGAWHPSDDYPGPITIRMPTRLSKSQTATGEAISTDVSSATVSRTLGSIREGFIVDETGSEPRVYRKGTYEAQASYLKFLRDQMALVQEETPEALIEAAIKEFQEREGLTLTKEQGEAVRSAVHNPLTVIIGEAGSGKTTVLKAILDILASLRLKTKGMGDVGKNIVCVAPTGKAARVFHTKTGWPSSTIDSLLVRLNHAESIHSFLGLSEGEEVSWHPIVVVDEMSMVTLRHTRCFEKLELMAKAAGNVGLDRVVLLGDLSQLAPIGPGDVFHDTVQIIKALHEDADSSGLPPPQGQVVTLRGSQRVDPSASLIYENSRLLRSDRKRRGVEDVETVEAFPKLETTSFSQAKGTFELVDSSYDKIDGKIMHDCHKVWAAESKRGWGRQTPQPLSTLQILTDTNAKRKEINKKVQEMVQADASCAAAVELSKGEYGYLYDKVMVCDNAMEFGVVNGDIGWIMTIPRQDQVRLLLEGGKQVLVNTSLVRMTLAYAITVHKSQGSEFPFVMCVFYKKFRHTTRDLLYTALSRGRKHVKVISGYGAFDKALATRRPERQSDAFRIFFKEPVLEDENENESQRSEESVYTPPPEDEGLSLSGKESSDDESMTEESPIESTEDKSMTEDESTNDKSTTNEGTKTKAVLALAYREPALLEDEKMGRAWESEGEDCFSDGPLIIGPRVKAKPLKEEKRKTKVVKSRTKKQGKRK